MFYFSLVDLFMFIDWTHQINIQFVHQYQNSFNHFASVDVYTRKAFPNCKTEDVYTRFSALF